MKDHPLIKVTLLYISGIILQRYLNLNINLLFPLSLLFVISSCFLFFGGEKTRIFSFFSAGVCLIFIAGLSFQLSCSRLIPYPFTTDIIKETAVYGKVSGIELKSGKGFRFTLDTDSLIIKNRLIKTGIKLLCNIRDDNPLKMDSLYKKIKNGNYIIIKGILSKAREIRNPFEFDFQNYLVQKGYSGVFKCYATDSLKIIKDKESLIPNLIQAIRVSIDKKIYSIHSNDCSALLRGLILADRGEISDEIETDFINTGVVHILAVSGSNVLLVILIFSLLFGRFHIYSKTFLMIAGLIVFLLLTGITASVLRAVIMAAALLFSHITNRSRNLYNAVSLSALIILIADPLQLFDPGFQLSYSAVLSIMLIHPRIKNALETYLFISKNKFVKNVLVFSAVTFSAQIGTLPFTLYYFSKLSAIALAANLLIIPVIAVITGSGIFAILLSLVWDWGCKIFAAADNTLTQFIYSTVHYLSTLKYSYLFIRDFTIFDAFIFYFFLFFFIAVSKEISGMRSRIILLTLTISCILVYFRLDNRSLLPEGKLSVLAIDVGQGDATLIKFPDGRAALIDAGETNNYFDNGKKVIQPLLMHLGIDSLSYCFVTHIDSDHYSGFVPLVEAGFVKRIYKPLTDTSYKKDTDFEKFLFSRTIPIKYYKKEVISVGNTRLYLMNPEKGNRSGKLSMNDKGGIIKIVYGRTSFLFAGDAGIKAEKILEKNFGRNLQSDLLKLGHHGSKGSSSLDFLKNVNPKYALISAGVQNRFHHPAPEVIKRLDSLNIKVLRTDLRGATIIDSDGERIKVTDWRSLL